MREKLIESALVREVEARGGLCLKFVSPGRRGVPDRICLFPGGRVVFVELKQKGKKPRPDQEALLSSLSALGLDVHVVDEVSQIRRVVDGTGGISESGCGMVYI